MDDLTITAVHGLGGQGKTELAVAYAHAFADSYPGGLWVLGAEGKSELLPLIGELAFAPELHFTPTEAQKADPVLLGRGKRLFADRVDARELAFVSTKSTPTGVLLNTYRYVGALRA